MVNNYILFPVQGLGSGVAVAWNPNNSPFTVRAVYIALAGDNPSSDSPAFVPGVFPIGSTLYPNGTGKRGLFGDPNQGIVELEYSPSQAFTLRFHYSGGNVLNGRFDVFGANFELALSDRIAVFGRYRSVLQLSSYQQHQDYTSGAGYHQSCQSGCQWHYYCRHAKNGIFLLNRSSVDRKLLRSPQKSSLRYSLSKVQKSRLLLLFDKIKL